MTRSMFDPLIGACAVAATLMIPRTVAMAWLTVPRMMAVKGGYPAPEDIRRTPLDPDHLLPDERVERMRRMHQNDLETVPFFLAAGFPFVLTGPPLWVAQVLLYGYAASRFLHFWAYAASRTQDTRATFWTIGVVPPMRMPLWVLAAALVALAA